MVRLSKRTFSSWLVLLTQYHSEHGHCRVKRSQLINGAKLGVWVNSIRKKMLHGKLSSGQIIALDNIGFQWSVISSAMKFSDGLLLLKQFKAKHGHCNVPYFHPQNQRFGTWCHNIRAQYARKIRGEKSYVPNDHIKALEDIGLLNMSSRAAYKSLLSAAFSPIKSEKLSLSDAHLGAYSFIQLIPTV